MTVPQKISARRPRSSAISAGSPSPISRGPHLSPSGRGSPSGSSRSNSLSARSSPTPSGSPGARQPASGSPVPNLRPILRPTRRVTFPRYQWLHAVPPPPFPTRPRLPMSPTGPVITDHGMDGHRAAWAARMGSVWLHYSLRFAPSTSIPEEMFVAAVTDVALQRMLDDRGFGWPLPTHLPTYARWVQKTDTYISDSYQDGVLSLSTTVGNLPLPTFNEVRSWARAVLNANYLVGSDGSDYPDGCEEFHRPLDFDFIPLTDPHNPNNQAFIECLLDPGNMTLGEQFRWLPPMSRPSE